MATLEVVVSIKRNGVEMFGAPIRRRLEVDEAVGPTTYDAVTGAGYVTLPVTVLDTVNMLLARTDRAVTIRLDGQSSAGIELQPGGVLLIMDAVIDAGASTNATASNASGETAHLTVMAGGT